MGHRLQTKKIYHLKPYGTSNFDLRLLNGHFRLTSISFPTGEQNLDLYSNFDFNKVLSFFQVDVRIFTKVEYESFDKDIHQVVLKILFSLIRSR